MTMVRSIRKGDKFWCFHRRLGGRPLVGTVIALTTEVGKQIGLEFEQDIGGHSCDGRGKNGHCLWVLPEHILTDEEYMAQLEAAKAAKDNAAVVQDLDELVLNPPAEGRYEPDQA